MCQTPCRGPQALAQDRHPTGASIRMVFNFPAPIQTEKMPDTATCEVDKEEAASPKHLGVHRQAQLIPTCCLLLLGAATWQGLFHPRFSGIYRILVELKCGGFGSNPMPCTRSYPDRGCRAGLGLSLRVRVGQSPKLLSMMSMGNTGDLS